jgi:carboxyl-terminal processing protease
LNEAVNICNLCTENEVIVTTKSKKNENTTPIKTTMEPVDTAIPLVIIINDKSASASEIVAARYKI